MDIESPDLTCVSAIAEMVAGMVDEILGWAQAFPTALSPVR